MKTLAKVSMVAAGYGLAALIAAAAVALHMMLTAAEGQGSDGMDAFGDLLLFIGVFGLFALAPTGAAVYWLIARRPRRHRERGA